VTPIYELVSVECYAGYKGEEEPRAIVLEGQRFGVAGILSRERTLDGSSGRLREAWRCRLSDGRVATLELLEPGAWRVSF
jgi:hypothetical protein